MTARHRNVRVKFQSGYKGEEIPRSVIFEGQEHPIEKVLERQRILDHSSGERREEYKIRIQGKTAFLRIYDSSVCEIIFPDS